MEADSRKIIDVSVSKADRSAKREVATTLEKSKSREAKF